MHAVYGTRDLERLLGITASTVRSFIRAGHVKPSKGASGRLRFSFQDLIVLRTAHTLSGANVSTRRLNRCMRQLREALPAEIPLSGLSITAIGDRIVVREGRNHWESESKQFLLALEVVVDGGEVRVIRRDTAASDDDVPGVGVPAGSAPAGLSQDDRDAPAMEAASDYDSAHELEESDPAAAIEAYRRCLAANAEHPEARLNCGRLLHLAGQLAEAERIYRESPEPGALLLFNLAVLLEDRGRSAEAMQAYRRALDLDPDLADAHFNLARLHELAGNRRESFRHLLAYRRAGER